jgi:CheY-like chemotaxis protein
MTDLASLRPATESHPPATVLVVDDSYEMLGLIGAWLQDEGYFVVTAASGMQALDAAETHEPDVVLLDVVIPAPDGFAVCATLQHHERSPEIILMTGISDPTRLRGVDDLGGLVLLRKPLTYETVVDTVARAVARRVARRTHNDSAS